MRRQKSTSQAELLEVGVTAYNLGFYPIPIKYDKEGYWRPAVRGWQNGQFRSDDITTSKSSSPRALDGSIPRPVRRILYLGREKAASGVGILTGKVSGITVVSSKDINFLKSLPTTWGYLLEEDGYEIYYKFFEYEPKIRGRRTIYADVENDHSWVPFALKSPVTIKSNQIARLRPKDVQFLNNM